MAQDQKKDPAGSGPATGNKVQTTQATTRTQPRRGPGSKEVVPMAWKLVGMSDGMPVTLLKCIDRDDADAQLERLKGERYYKDLAVYAIDDRVPIPAAAAKARRKAIDEAISRIAARNARIKTGRGRGRASAGTVREPAARAKKPTAKRKETAAKAPSKTKAAERTQATAKPKPKAKAEAKRTVKAKTAKKVVKKPKAKTTTKAATRAKACKRAKSASKPKAGKAKKSTRGRK